LKIFLIKLDNSKAELQTLKMKLASHMTMKTTTTTKITTTTMTTMTKMMKTTATTTTTTMMKMTLITGPMTMKMMKTGQMITFLSKLIQPLMMTSMFTSKLTRARLRNSLPILMTMPLTNSSPTRKKSKMLLVHLLTLTKTLLVRSFLTSEQPSPQPPKHSVTSSKIFKLTKNAIKIVL
jgi:hypothetical protein